MLVTSSDQLVGISPYDLSKLSIWIDKYHFLKTLNIDHTSIIIKLLLMHNSTSHGDLVFKHVLHQLIFIITNNKY